MKNLSNGNSMELFLKLSSRMLQHLRKCCDVSIILQIVLLVFENYAAYRQYHKILKLYHKVGLENS